MGVRCLLGVETGAENLANTGIRSPDRPAHSSVAIPTELSRHTHLLAILKKGRKKERRKNRERDNTDENKTFTLLLVPALKKTG
jgi:hypothetical protein